MLRTHAFVVPALTACALLGTAGTAVAHTPSGGAALPERPQIDALACEATDVCAAGDVVRVDGENLQTTRTVVFLGSRGKADNRTARPTGASAHKVVVRVPTAAASGPVRVKTRLAGASPRKGPAIELGAAPATTDTTGGAFPVDGSYDFGTAVNGFGGGRGHQGQDILADCGTPVLAAEAGKVTRVSSEGAAGNHAVIQADDGSSQVYMHLLAPATVAKGASVGAGEQIGEVGQTGRASACHLHFEIWTAPGWYEGGEPIDPLPALKALEEE